MSASEAAWRFFEYDTTRRDPSVKVYPVHLPDRDHVTYKKGQRQAAVKTMSKLDRYFHGPSVAEFDKLTYLEYQKKFVITKQAPNTFKETWIDQASTELTNTVYRRKKQHVARMHNIHIKAGDVWYLRQILKLKPARSYEELLQVSSYSNIDYTP